jgi:hypothetical protein
MGLRINTDIPAEVLNFLSLYPQSTRTQGGVDYLPVPHRRQYA